MTVLIIEDEIPAGKRLEKLLTQNGFTVLTILVSIKNAIKWFSQNSMPDIIFMDIKLRDGNSFLLFEKVNISSKIVFTTAYDEFALKAFDYYSVDYLLKPIDEKKLKKMTLKLNMFKEGQLHCDLKFLKENAEKNFKSSFLIAIGNSLKKIETDEITSLFSENNSTYLTTKQNRIYPINNSLDKLEQQLDDKHFFRISRKFIVHKKYIFEISNKNHLTIQITNTSENLKVSRLKTKLFLEWYEK